MSHPWWQKSPSVLKELIENILELCNFVEVLDFWELKSGSIGTWKEVKYFHTPLSKPLFLVWKTKANVVNHHVFEDMVWFWSLWSKKETATKVSELLNADFAHNGILLHEFTILSHRVAGFPPFHQKISRLFQDCFWVDHKACGLTRRQTLKILWGPELCQWHIIVTGVQDYKY
jgi:hypothetical protein